VLVPSIINVCMGFPLVSFRVMPFIFHCIFPSFSGTLSCVVIVLVRLFVFPAVSVFVVIVIFGVFLLMVIVLVLFAGW